MMTWQFGSRSTLQRRARDSKRFQHQIMQSQSWTSVLPQIIKPGPRREPNWHQVGASATKMCMQAVLELIGRAQDARRPCEKLARSCGMAAHRCKLRTTHIRAATLQLKHASDAHERSHNQLAPPSDTLSQYGARRKSVSPSRGLVLHPACALRISHKTQTCRQWCGRAQITQAPSFRPLQGRRKQRNGSARGWSRTEVQ